MTEPCDRGCSIRGQHLSGCAGDPCTGCLPRPAEYGRLCLGCHGRLTRAIYQAPELVDYLRCVGPAQSGDDTVDGTREAPIPLNTAAVDAADHLHALLCSWVGVVVDEHPAGLHGPDPTGTRFTHPSKRRHHGDAWSVGCADCGELRGTRPAEPVAVRDVQDHATDTGHLVGWAPIDPQDRWAQISYRDPQPAGLLQTGDATATGAVAQWLLVHQDWCEQQAWIDEMADELCSTIATLSARFPDHERDRHIPDVTCPECNRITLTYHPPVFFQADFLVMCDHHDCSAKIPEERWGLFVRRIIDEHGERPRPAERQRVSIGSGRVGYGGAA